MSKQLFIRVGAVIAITILLSSCAISNNMKQFATVAETGYMKTVPYTLADDGRMLIPVSIKGQTFKAMFDTGSPTGHLPLDTAQKLGIRTSGSKRSTDITGIASRQRLAKTDMEIAGLKFSDAVFTVSDDQPFVVLGHKAITATNWFISPDSKSLILSDKPFSPRPAPSFKFESPAYSMISTDVLIDGVKQRIGFDYGAVDDLILSSTSALGMHLLQKYKLTAEYKTLHGLAEKRDDVAFYHITLPEVTLGPITVRDVKTVIIEGGGANIFGAQFLNRFTVIINGRYRTERDVYHQVILEDHSL